MREIERVSHKATLYSRAYKRLQKTNNTRTMIICKATLKIWARPPIDRVLSLIGSMGDYSKWEETSCRISILLSYTTLG